MDNRRLGAEGFSVARPWWMAERPLEVARAVNHAVVATEWVARLILMLALVLVLYYAADREPPFGVTSTLPAEGRAGDYITMRAKVRRDISRGCSSEISRFVFDSSGARFDLGHATFSAETIARMSKTTPGELVVSFRIPPNAAIGGASLVTEVDYICNRVHRVFPIHTTVDMPFTVLP